MEQLAAIRKSQYVWLSHGHPDHLHAESLEQLRDKKILLPDHVGKRIFDGLSEQGFDVQTMRIDSGIHSLITSRYCAFPT